MTERRQQSQDLRRVVLAAGGTGGHIFPARALAHDLLDRGLEVHLVTDSRGQGFGQDLTAVTTHRISAGTLGGGTLAKLRGAAKVALGLLQARRLLRQLAPDVVVGFGGYPSLPTVFAAGQLGLRVVLHEQNAVLGRANRLLAGKAQHIATAFDKVARVSASDLGKLVVTGNPVREAIVNLGLLPFPALQADGPLRLLVIGGSQGASVFNDLIPAATALLPEALRQRLEVSQQVRGGDSAALTQRYSTQGVDATLAPFFEDMPERLGQAHLVICRAGASTIAELEAASRPAILVPYPHATDDHQTLNAQALSEVSAAWLMAQDQLTAEALAERLTCLLSDPTRLQRAAQQAGAKAKRDAAQRLGDLVCGSHQGQNGDHQENDSPTDSSEEKAA